VGTTEIDDPAKGRALLAVAHPGHELAVHGWLERARPTVVILTDGSGSDGASRLASTRSVLADAGASEGPIFGPFPERIVYGALLAGTTDLFVEVAAGLSDLLGDEGFVSVAGEASEGFNPVHDVWRWIVDAAVVAANRRRRQPLRNRQFVLFGRQEDVAPSRYRDALRVELDDAGYARKLAVARQYPELTAEVTAALSGSAQALLGGFPELAERIRPLMDRMGPEAHRVELLFEAANDSPPDYDDEPLFYEAYGERLAALGRFAQVIRYRQHMLPVRAALAEWAAGPTRGVG
jgi:hypothetical protein